MTTETYTADQVRSYLSEQRKSDEVDCNWSWISREGELRKELAEKAQTAVTALIDGHCDEPVDCAVCWAYAAAAYAAYQAVAG